MFIKFVDTDWLFFCVILTLVYSLRVCQMWLTRNYMFISGIRGKLTSFIFWNFEISLVSLGRFQNFKKVNSEDLSQISLLNMWLLVQISRVVELLKSNEVFDSGNSSMISKLSGIRVQSPQSPSTFCNFRIMVKRIADTSS